MSGKSPNESGAPQRRRGRPTGQNRVPLTLEERRARNAQYERERRGETADAIAQLAQAVACDTNMSNADIMATAVCKIQRSADEPTVDELRRMNCDLEAQIAMLQAQLGLDDKSMDLLYDEEHDAVFSPQSTSSSEYSSDVQPPTRVSQKRKRRSSLSERDGDDKRARTATHTSTHCDTLAAVALTPDTVIQLLTEDERQLIDSWLEQEGYHCRQ